MDISRGRIIGLGLAGLTLAATIVVLATSASAQDPATRTLSFETLDKGSTFKHVRSTPGRPELANAAGDVIVFTDPLADGTGKVVGRLYAECATTKGARNFLRSILTCTAVIALPDGTLTLQANAKPSVPLTTGAVTGGTGAYANSRGVFVDDDASGDITITLAG